MTEDGRRKTEDGRRKTEDGRLKTEDGRRKTEDRRLKKEGGIKAAAKFRIFMSQSVHLVVFTSDC